MSPQYCPSAWGRLKPVKMVPTVRLELTRVSPPPPQDGVSTNFTTSATSFCARTTSRLQSAANDTRGLLKNPRITAVFFYFIAPPTGYLIEQALRAKHHAQCAGAFAGGIWGRSAAGVGAVGAGVVAETGAVTAGTEPDCRFTCCSIC